MRYGLDLTVQTEEESPVSLENFPMELVTICTSTRGDFTQFMGEGWVTNFSKYLLPIYEAAMEQSETKDVFEVVKGGACNYKGDPVKDCYRFQYKIPSFPDKLDEFYKVFDSLNGG